MISFLILPMQRVTRLPLLTDVSTRPDLGQGEGGRPADGPELPRPPPPGQVLLPLAFSLTLGLCHVTVMRTMTQRL